MKISAISVSANKFCTAGKKMSKPVKLREKEAPVDQFESSQQTFKGRAEKAILGGAVLGALAVGTTILTGGVAAPLWTVLAGAGVGAEAGAVVGAVAEGFKKDNEED